jgi:hypothetical protein
MFEIFEESVGQKEKFKTAANKLLNQCFLVKKKEETKKEYIFIMQNLELCIPYFELLGYELRINENQGVIALENLFGTGRLQLTKYESIMLLIFRLLYIEKRKEVGTFSEEVVVLMEEIREKYGALKIEQKPMLDKKMEREIISLFKKYNLVKNIEGDITLSDARIIIYPAITMAVPIEDMNLYYEQMSAKVKAYAKGREDDESKQITDQDTID